MCEVFNRYLKKIIQISKTANSDWKGELNAFLRSYRSTAHSSTGVSPASLIFISPNLCRLPSLDVPLEGIAAKRCKLARESDSRAKARVKRYADKRRKARYHDFKIGQKVLLQKFINQKVFDKSETKFESSSFTVEAIKGAMVTNVNEKGERWTRNAAFLKLDTRASMWQRAGEEVEVDFGRENRGGEIGVVGEQLAGENQVGDGQPEVREIVELIENRTIEEPRQLRVSARAKRVPEFYQAGFN